MKVFLDRDGDAHWYIVQADKRKEWNEWVNMDQDDPASWNVPKFAKEIDHPNQVEFEYD